MLHSLRRVQACACASCSGGAPDILLEDRDGMLALHLHLSVREQLPS